MISYLLSFLAGLLTAISPCVLPALPLIVGSAVQEHRHAPMAVAAGLVFSFTALGVFFSTAGMTFGLDPSNVRLFAAGFILVFGLVLLVPNLQVQLQKVLSPLSNLFQNKMAARRFKGLNGQFGLGCLLGGVWSPCVGPTLGAAMGLASQSSGLVPATGMMLLFGLGSSLPILGIAYGWRKFFATQRKGILEAAKKARSFLGITLTVVGLLILTGWDKTLEAAVLKSLPNAWINLITRF